MGIFYTSSQSQYSSGMDRYGKGIILALLFLGFSFQVMAQQPIVFQPAKALAPIVRNKPVTVKTVNLLDVDPQFRRKAVKFVPFKATKEAEARGLKADSNYVWTDPNGNIKKASGKQILQSLNEFEKELNKRGHSLRDKETFKNIRADMQYLSTGTAVNAANVKIFAKMRGKDLSYATATVNTRELKFYNYLYFGRFEYFSGEFPDQLEVEYNMELTREKGTIALPVSIALLPDVAKLATHYELELYESPNDQKPRYKYIKLDFKPLAEYEITDKMRNRQIRGGQAPGKNYKIYYLKKELKIGAGFGLPSATYQVKKYYPRIKLYDRSGDLLKTEMVNNPVLGNYLYDWTMPVDHYSNINFFDESITDPITKTFGFYMKSNGFNAYAHHFTSKANKRVEDTTIINGHFDVGIKMYNWANLFDKSKPKTQDLSLLNIEIEGINGRILSTNKKPPKNNKKEIAKDKNVKVYYSFIGEKRKQLTESVKQPYTQVLFDQRFMLGPIPCRATIKLDGSIGINYGGYTRLEETSEIKTVIEPYANLNVNGSGGADAVVAYAKILAKIDLIDMTVPINFYAESNRKADVNSKMTISGFDGEIGFKAGICIPIPFFDDLCKEFRINIFNWNGMSETIDFREDI